MNIEPGWRGMSPGYILEYFCLRKRPQRPNFEAQNLNFHIFRPHLWKRPFWLFVPNPLFESRIFKSTLYKMFLWTVRTILVFSKKSPRYGKTLPKNGFWGKWIFEISVKKAKFIGDKCCFFWRSCILGVWTYIWGSGLIFWGSGLIFWGSGLILWGSGLIFWGSGLIL